MARRTKTALAIALLAIMLIGSASAATMNGLMNYVKGQGFSVSVKATNGAKENTTYQENKTGKDKLTWTSKNGKIYTATASTKAKKLKLRLAGSWVAQNYKWKSAVYKVNGVAKYGYNKKAEHKYTSLAKYRAAVKKYVDGQTVQKKRYVLNTSTKKFHLPTCNDIAKMAAENRKDVKDTREHLIEMGYSPCGHCKP